jgi:hypothetical protein
MTTKSDGAYDYSSIQEFSWTPFERTEDYIRSFTIISIDGMPVRAERTQYLADETLQRANTQEFNDSDGKKWGDGKVVARLPMNVLFDPANQIAKKLKEGDRDHMTWWLNSDAARPFRTFKGRM